jgi:hypothetical protein
VPCWWRSQGQQKNSTLNGVGMVMLVQSRAESGVVKSNRSCHNGD